MTKKVFITGASGCVGHYLVESLIHKTDYELYLLVRDRHKLKVDINVRAGINIVEGTMQDIETYRDLLGTMNYVISTAAAWGGTEVTFDTNLHKTVDLFAALNPAVCERAIYFSTASILDQDNQLLPSAGEIGTDYIRSKYACLEKLEHSAISDRLITVFPTLVFGGDGNKPYSHLSGGLKEVAGYINLIRWVKGDGSLHFIHGSDIAQIITQLITSDDCRLSWDLDDFNFPVRLVLGEPRLTVNQAIAEACAFFKKPIGRWSPQLNLTPWLVDIVIKLFKIQVAEWDRFCIKQRHFTYKVVSPETFGLKSNYPNIASLLAEIN
ncbi:NAD dependent epimerase/dehydratase family protein [Synechococcus sp. PCC 7502]|uniref:NAD-dependent epimerase/dehydratase family protein n=1 Tax=Synechococcus sp. PCC 7502 TaxID=1173263 RepID=UPI00029FFF8D|nr:NAD(P)-dependent oxidoreductase [Synechococcus sp. PCC 7502]AFY74088.1 NAD dependent epimerase/dehydratase family protein [Synechococcus sp. PCC 7502]